MYNKIKRQEATDDGDSDDSLVQLFLRMVIDFFRGLFRTGK